MAGVCPVCIIDTCAARRRRGSRRRHRTGDGRLRSTLGFGFRAHRVGNRIAKGRIERPACVETNFCRPELRRSRRDPNARRSAGRGHRQPQTQTGAGHVTRGRLRHRAAAPRSAGRRTAAGLSVARNATSICTATSRSTPIATPFPSVTSANRSPSPRRRPKSRFATSPPRSPLHRRVIDQRDTRKVLPGHHTIPVRARSRHGRRGEGRCAAIMIASTAIPRYSRRHGRAQPAGTASADRDAAAPT